MSEQEKEAAASPSPGKQTPLPPFPVVGIGASAGGLRPLQRFLSKTPPGAGISYVVVMHLSPEHESHLASLLQPYTAMAVKQVQQTTQMEPNCVYVIPPGWNLLAIDTHLRLERLEPDRRGRAPIDNFFFTMASAHQAQAVGVILSGTGHDGALGMAAIKEAGGMTIAQEPSEAEHDSMPQSAIATGMVDMVLPVDQIPAHLLEYLRTKPDIPLPSDDESIDGDISETLHKILTQVRILTGHDFSRYKHSTILRRISRRMQIHSIANLSQYLRFVRSNDEELRLLFRDFLISVTSFFRDAEAFQLVEEKVIPKLFEGKKAGEQVRVWVIGCATGEEAYSIAMLLLEYAARLESRPEIQIFGSDLSANALRRAREGWYPETIATYISPQRLGRYFVQEAGGFRVRKELRDIVLFSPHDLLKDPPFSRLDLISCRNLLIYLERSLQRDIFESFHFALRPGGFLFLGPSETVDRSELFRTINKRHSIFQRANVAPHEVRLPRLPFGLPPRTELTADTAPGRIGAMNFAALHARLLENYTPASILVNGDYTVLYLSEEAGRYLYQPGGEPTNQILKCIREDLRVDLTAALYRAFEKNEATPQTRPVTLTLDGGTLSVRLSVWPADELEIGRVALVLFSESATRQESDEQEAGVQDQENVNALEEEIRGLKRRLQEVVEEYETSREEMNASNEELQSMNEELRSTAEELETSREELQSINEELLTLNQENKHKVEELSQLSNDLQNLLASTEIATLFLDRDLRIKRFTPRIRDIFNVMDTDHNRPLAHITHRLMYGRLLEDAEQVLRTLVPLEHEVQLDTGLWYLMRILPYRTMDDHIGGVVVTFVDITERKHYAETMRANLDQLQLALDPERIGIWNWQFESSVVILDGRAAELLGLDAVAVRTNLETAFAHVHPDDRAAIDARAWSGLEQGKRQRLELRIVDAQANVVRRIGGSGYAVRRGEETHDHLVGFLYDWDEFERLRAT